MKQVLLLIALLFLFAIPAKAQTQIQSGPTDPATCNVNVGQLFYNTTSLTMKTCSATNTWSAVGGSSTGTVGTGAAPGMGVYFGSNCPVANTGKCYFTTANAIQNNTANWSNASTTLNCTTCVFTSADVGKNIMGGQSCVDDAQGSGNGGQIATTTAVTIATFVSATQVTLSATPANTVAANGCIWYGNFDDANAVILDAALLIDPICQKLFYAAANYYYAKPHHKANPNACIASGPGGAGALSAGSTTLPAGFEWEGRGALNTTIVLDTSFPGGDACTTKAISTQNNGGCWVMPVLGKWRDFRFEGGAAVTAPNLAGKNLITMAVGRMDNITLTNMGWQTPTMVGINMAVLSMLEQVNSAGVGGIGIQAEASGGFDILSHVVVENSGTNALFIQGGGSTTTVTCYWCLFAMPKASTNVSVIRNSGGSLSMFGGSIQPSNAFGSTSTGVTGYRCDGANGTFKGDEVNFLFTAAVGGTGANSIWMNATGCTVSLLNSVVNGNTATSTAITDFGSTSGTRFNSLGGNTITGPITVGAGMSLNLAPTDTLTGASTYTGTCSSTGLAQTACALVAGSTNEKGTIRVTAGGVGGAFTETLNFMGTFFGANNTTPVCSFTYANTGTGTWTAPALLTTSSKSTTSYVIAGTGTTVNTSSYDIDYVCSAR